MTSRRHSKAATTATPTARAKCASRPAAVPASRDGVPGGSLGRAGCQQPPRYCCLTSGPVLGDNFHTVISRKYPRSLLLG